MKIGLAGYKGAGKSTLFEWLSEVAADPSKAHESQSAMALIPEPRIEDLCKIYRPKKVVYASMEIVDTPGLDREQQGNSAVLSHLREVDYLVCLIPVFDGAEPLKEISSFQEELILADLEIVLNRIERVKEQKKRPLARDLQEKLTFELETLEVFREALESGRPIRASEMTDEQYKVTRSFQFLTEKEKMYLVNTSDEETDRARFESLSTPESPVLAVSLRLESELAQMTPEDRDSFLKEMELTSCDRAALVRAIMDNSGQMLFLTAGEKEVRSWLMRKGGTALEAAGCIHTDFIKKFIRAEVTPCDDLVRLGGEREIKAAGLNRREPKDYVIQEGDVLLFHIS